MNTVATVCAAIAFGLLLSVASSFFTETIQSLSNFNEATIFLSPEEKRLKQKEVAKRLLNLKTAPAE